MIIYIILSILTIMCSILSVFVYILYIKIKNIPKYNDILNDLNEQLTNEINNKILNTYIDNTKKFDIINIHLNKLDNAIKILNTGFVVPSQSYMS